MSNIENIKVLAAVAHESENYEQSYSYYSKILEEKIENPEAWIRKGVAAANLTDSSGGRIKEARALIQRGAALTAATDDDRRATASALKVAYETLVGKLDDELLGKIKDYQKVGMPAGGSALIHMAGQAVNKVMTAKAQAQARYGAVDLVVLMCEVEPVRGNFAYAIGAVDRLLLHSKNNGNYLNNEGSAKFLQNLARIKATFFRADSNIQASEPTVNTTENIFEETIRKSEEARMRGEKPTTDRQKSGTYFFGIIFLASIGLVLIWGVCSLIFAFVSGFFKH